MDQPSIDKRGDHKLEGATAAFFSPALHDWLSTKQPHHVSCINNTVSRGTRSSCNGMRRKTIVIPCDTTNSDHKEL